MPEARRGRRAAPEPPDGEAAMEIAARFLATRPRSRREVERRLQRAGAPEELITATIERMKHLGYVDDAAFVRWWTEQRDRHSPRGRRLVEAEFRQRGIGREEIETLRATWEEPERSPGDEHLPATDAERATVALQRHLRGRAIPDDRQAVQRLGMFLVRRGFDPETARAAIRMAQREAGEAAAADDDDST